MATDDAVGRPSAVSGPAGPGSAPDDSMTYETGDPGTFPAGQETATADPEAQEYPASNVPADEPGDATASRARRRALLQMTRAGYGTALIVAPGPVICLATGRSPGRGECRAARLLGARHLVQAAVTALAPLPGVFATGAAVDAVHAASMLLRPSYSSVSRELSAPRMRPRQRRCYRSLSKQLLPAWLAIQSSTRVH
jgi:hypothetical protein